LHPVSLKREGKKIPKMTKRGEKRGSATNYEQGVPTGRKRIRTTNTGLKNLNDEEKKKLRSSKYSITSKKVQIRNIQ